MNRFIRKTEVLCNCAALSKKIPSKVNKFFLPSIVLGVYVFLIKFFFLSKKYPFKGDNNQLKLNLFKRCLILISAVGLSQYQRCWSQR